jgi:hypothetical protein
MDGASGPQGSRFAVTSQKEDVTNAGNLSEQERHDIFVRAHTSVPTKSQSDRRWSPKWPRYCLIFDTETTLDPAQKLNFGTYRRCKLVGNKYVCLEEGIFSRDDPPPSQVKLLKRYKSNPKTLPSIELFPAAMTLDLMTRSSFIRRVFWKSVRKGELIVAFNLPFDVSRLATISTKGKKGEWSLALSSLWKNPKTGKVVPNPKRPRILVDAQNSKMAFIRLGSILHPEEWPKEGRFLDLRTLGWSLRHVSFNLKGACKAFGVEGKVEHKPSGQISPEEIEYCRGDVAATNRLLNAMMGEFDQHPIDLHPDKSYSPASIAKAYLKEMHVKRPKDHFKAANKSLGIAMQSYYGGRAECRIRKIPVPVIHTDFTSQYPTVNALLGNWDVLTSSSITFVNCTAPVKRLLSTVTLENTFDQSFWRKLSFFALVKPKDDILPVRTLYNPKTQNIGLNYFTSEKPIWYAGPDVIASAILVGKPPKILKAFRLVPHGRQSGLKPTNLGGMVEIDPIKDFYRKVIEQRISHKAANKGLADFLKVLANSGSYGLFVEVNTETKNKETKVGYYSGEKKGKIKSTYVEKPGAWYFPPLASLITSGGRLLLAMLEKSVDQKGGSYLFCDTDSLCVVGMEKGGFVPCQGGRFRSKGKTAIKALSLNEVRSIADNFNKLNPYDSSLVRHILKIEDVNFVGADPRKTLRQLFGYAISAKRYALYTQSGNDIHVEKASGHGLGYLFAPKERKKDEDIIDEETSQWVIEAWDFLLRKELGLPSKEPSWSDLPAMMRMVVTTPNVLKDRRPEWLGPFNFFLFPLLSELGGYPSGFDKSNFLFITPMESDRKKWRSLEGINLFDGLSYQIAMSPTGRQNKVIPESFRIILEQYLGKPEVKSLAPDGTPCLGTTRGLLRRARIVAGRVIPVAKETDRRWEQGEDPSMLDSSIHIYETQKEMCVADPSDRRRWRQIGVRNGMRRSGLSQKAVSAILNGEPVRIVTLATFKRAMEV